MPLAPLTLAIRARRAAFLASEPVEFTLILANPSPASVATALPEHDWWRGGRFVLTGPDGTATSFVLSHEPAVTHGPCLTVDDDADRAYSFSLNGRLPPLRPGNYRLDGALDAGGERWPVSGASFLVEPMQASRIASVPVSIGDDSLGLWVVICGESRFSLEHHELTPGAGAGEDRFAQAPARPVADLPAGVQQLAAGAGDDRCGPWAAWLLQDRLGIGCGLFPFHCTELALPGPAAELLPAMLRTEAGTQAFVLSADRATLWQVDVARPLPLPDDEPLSSFAPLPLHDVALSETIPLPVRPVALSAGAGLALLSGDDSVLELRFSSQRSGPGLRKWSSVGITGAAMLPGCPPACQRGGDGYVYVAVVFRDRHSSIDLGLAIVAFDADGQPVLASGTGRWRVSLPAEPKGGCCALRYDAEQAGWLVDWAVALSDGSWWLNHPPTTPRSVLPGVGLREQPLLVALMGTAAVARVTDEGLLQLDT